MKFNEIVAPSMKELFIKSIENMILSGQLKIGDKLPTERELASQMKVSRTIVNLGLNELQSKGFIEIIPRQGTYVIDYIRHGELETLMSILAYNGGSFDQNIFDSLMTFRKINEGAGAYLAALNRTDQDLAEMEALYEQMLVCDSYVELATFIFDWNRLIFYASGNYIFPLVHNAFRNVSITLTSRIFKYFDAKETTNDIKAVTEMIKARDPEGSKLAMEALIKHGVEKLEQNYFNNH